MPREGGAVVPRPDDGTTAKQGRDEMSETTTAERVCKIVTENLGVSPEKVTMDALLVPTNDGRGRVVASDQADLGADSLDVVELVMAFEDEFGVDITDDETEKLNAGGTVKDCVDLVETKLAA